jgi:hypothetical protein
MGKTKCVKDFRCEVCGIPGMLQVLSERYARVRHYKCLKNGKPVFEYHRNSIEYVNGILANIKDDQSNHKSSSGQCKASFSIDQNLKESSSDLEKNGRGCPSLVGGRPAKPVVSNGRVGSNPTPRANTIQ